MHLLVCCVHVGNTMKMQVQQIVSYVWLVIMDRMKEQFQGGTGLILNYHAGLVAMGDIVLGPVCLHSTRVLLVELDGIHLVWLPRVPCIVQHA